MLQMLQLLADPALDGIEEGQSGSSNLHQEGEVLSDETSDGVSYYYRVVIV